MRPLIWICIALYTLAMAGVSYYAHRSGVVGGVLTLAAMYGTAVYWDRRRPL